MEIKLQDSTFGGRLGIFHLGRLWSRCLLDRSGLLSGGDRFANEWALDNVIYHGLNIPIEETIQYLYQTAPTLAEFEDWIVQRNGGMIAHETIDRINATVQSLISGEAQSDPGGAIAEPLLSVGDLEFWHRNGYLTVSGIFEQDEIREAEKAVWEHLSMDSEDPETWYARSQDHGIMVQLFHHPALDALRKSAALKTVFGQIWGTSDLLISTDRVSFNPPERPGHEFPGPRLHWDVSLEPPIPFGVQGLIYLTDTEPEQGAFTCVPGFHTRIESWLKSLPPEADPRQEDLESLDSRPIPGKAGDVVIWHQALPHGSRANRCTRPRIVQYVTMFPPDAAYAERWR